jgi:hypothetical protein
VVLTLGLGLESTVLVLGSVGFTGRLSWGGWSLIRHHLPSNPFAVLLQDLLKRLCQLGKQYGREGHSGNDDSSMRWLSCVVELWRVSKEFRLRGPLT